MEGFVDSLSKESVRLHEQCAMAEANAATLVEENKLFAGELQAVCDAYVTTVSSIVLVDCLSIDFHC